MKTLLLKPLWHDDRLHIAIRGWMEKEAFGVVNNFHGRKYSSTHKCYYVPYGPGILEKLRQALCDHAEVNESGWSKTPGSVLPDALARAWISIPQRFTEMLEKLRYSPVTIENYKSQFKIFLSFIYPKTAEEINEQDIHHYMLYLVNERRVSYSTQNQAINAIKFYLEKVLNKDRSVYPIERPRKEVKLPTVMSEQEVKLLLDHTVNLKHKCILYLLYSAGLRMSEVLRLKPADLDPDRGLIYIRCAKHHKDRVSLLFPSD